MSRLSNTASFWILVALLVLLLLQWFPITGVFLMFVGAPFIAGLLVHVFLGSVAIEGLTGRLPRLLLILPVGAYGAYYAAYVAQGVRIAQTSAALSAGNPGLVLQFDPAQNALVMAHAGGFVTQHAVEVAFEPNANYQPEGHLSHRLIGGMSAAQLRATPRRG